MASSMSDQLRKYFSVVINKPRRAIALLDDHRPEHEKLELADASMIWSGFGWIIARA